MEKEVDIVALGELLIDFTEAGYGKDGIPDIVYWKSRKRHAWCIFKKNLTK